MSDFSKIGRGENIYKGIAKSILGALLVTACFALGFAAAGWLNVPSFLVPLFLVPAVYCLSRFGGWAFQWFGVILQLLLLGIALGTIQAIAPGANPVLVLIIAAVLLQFLPMPSIQERLENWLTRRRANKILDGNNHDDFY